jgi:hypothetical protein
MEQVRRADPKFVNYDSRTAAGAVERFCKFQRNGLPHTRIPEALIECAQGLSESELDLFEQWIINPNDVKGLDAAVIGRENYETHMRLVGEHELRCGLVKESEDDEKCAGPATLETLAEEKVELSIKG